MIDEATREQVVDALVNFPAEQCGNIPAVLADIKQRFPAISEDEIFDCLSDAADQIEARAAKGEAEADALSNLAPLFEGMPDDMELGECARIKAEQGDPLALAFLRWEADQAGGVQ